jgi:hypothetical protein
MHVEDPVQPWAVAPSKPAAELLHQLLTGYVTFGCSHQAVVVVVL